MNRQKNRGTKTVAFTQVPTLTTTWAVVPDLIVLQSQTSFNETKNEGATSTAAFSELLRVKWHMKDLVKNYAEPALSLRFNYNQNKVAAGLGSPDQWGIFLVFDLFARLPILPATWANTFVPAPPQAATKIGAAPGTTAKP